MSLLQALMDTQELSKMEALEVINEMKERIVDGENPEEILFEEGLEPDYIFDLI
jgi:hypothetical protein